MLDPESYANPSDVWIASIPLNFADILLTCVKSILQELCDIGSLLRAQKVVAVDKQLEICQATSIACRQRSMQELKPESIVEARCIVLNPSNPTQTRKKYCCRCAVLARIKARE